RMPSRRADNGSDMGTIRWGARRINAKPRRSRRQSAVLQRSDARDEVDAAAPGTAAANRAMAVPARGRCRPGGGPHLLARNPRFGATVTESSPKPCGLHDAALHIHCQSTTWKAIPVGTRLASQY